MPDKRFHILFLPSWYPNETSPQNGDFIQRHAQAVSELCDVTVLFLKRRKQNTKIEISDTKQGNLREVIVYFNNRLSYLKNFRNYFKTLNSGNNKFDLVHLNVAYPAGILALYLKKKYNLKYIYTEHWTAFTNGNFEKFRFIKKLIIRKIAKRAEVILPVSHDLAYAMQKYGLKNNYQIVPNVVNTNIFNFENNQKKLEIFTILHVSSLKDEHKNISGILRATKKVSGQTSDFQVIIVGNDNFEHYKTYSRELGISEKNIIFKGNMPQSQIAELMQVSDIFVLFSNYENAPCVISEAHVCGLPVLSTSVGGIPEMIDDTNGILISAYDENALAANLLQIVETNTFNSKIIAETAFKRYNPKIVANQYLNLYTKILNI